MVHSHRIFKAEPTTVKKSNTIRPWHPSFSDFLRDRLRCQQFVVDEQALQQQIALACLETMNYGLKRDICEVEDLHLLDRDVPDMENRVEEKIPKELEYSCIHWASHVSRTLKHSSVRLLMMSAPFMASLLT